MKIVEVGTIFKEKDEQKMEKQQKQFEEIKETFKDRIVTDDFIVLSEKTPTSSTEW